MIIGLFAWRFSAWAAKKGWRSTKRALTCLGGCLLLATFAGISIRTEYVKEKSAPVSVPPFIEASYNLDGMALPMSIPPSAHIDIIKIKKNRTAEPEVLENHGAKVWHWPTGKKVVFPDDVGRVELINQGNVEVFNVRYAFTLRMGSPQEAGGETSIPVYFPLADLPAGIPKDLYIVDQSGLGGIVDLSNEATGQVQGSSKHIKIAVEVRSLTFFDKLPMAPITTHHWNGDEILDPDVSKK